ncbi:MAG: hypothetical protein ACKO0Z_15040 [Betaproteobacteria bacterium]
MVQADSGPGHSSEKSPYQFGTWYPIESAPKDDIYVVLLCDLEQGNVPIVASRIDEPDPYEGPYGKFVWSTNNDGGIAEKVPTHWMPLPPPPSNDDRTEDPESEPASMSMTNPMGAVHINRPSSTRYIARVREPGAREYKLVSGNLKRYSSAVRVMAMAFTSGNYKRGDVIMVADYYDPVIVTEIVRRA